jgi:hypothetical protein
MSGKASATRESCARARGRHSSAAASGGPCSRLLYGGASRFHDMSRSVPTLPGDDRLPLLGVNGAATAMGLIGPPKRAKCAIVQKSITPATRGNARERLVFQHNGVRPRFCDKWGTLTTGPQYSRCRPGAVGHSGPGRGVCAALQAGQLARLAASGAHGATPPGPAPRF